MASDKLYLVNDNTPPNRVIEVCRHSSSHNKENWKYNEFWIDSTTFIITWKAELPNTTLIDPIACFKIKV